MVNKLTQSLQESVLTLLAIDDEQGAIAANLIDTELFEPPLDDIAHRAIEYRRRFHKAPGLSHVDDLFDEIISDPKNKKQRIYQQILGAIVEQAKGLNAPYVLSRLHEFMRQQELKAAVLEAAQRYTQGGDDLVPAVEGILHKALKFKHEPLDAGTFLNDKKRSLAFLTNPSAFSYALGIPELDRRQIGPTIGQALAFTAPKGRGKTWLCIHASIMAVLQNARVVHISLEMSEEELMQRYMQRLFAVSKRRDKYQYTTFELDDLNRVVGFDLEKRKPELHLQDERIIRKLSKKLDQFGSRFGRLIVKQFPTSSLTMGQLEAYLDNLELSCKFTPTVLVLDYPKLMGLDRRQELRLALGLRLEELRGLCIRRNMAGIFPLQGNRESEGVKLITGQHVGEDYSLGQTADVHLTYNQTPFEHKLNLARLYVDKARGDDDKFTILLTQNYTTGQFVTGSAYMPNDYFEKVKTQAGGDSDD